MRKETGNKKDILFAGIVLTYSETNQHRTPRKSHQPPQQQHPRRRRKNRSSNHHGHGIRRQYQLPPAPANRRRIILPRKIRTLRSTTLGAIMNIPTTQELWHRHPETQYSKPKLRQRSSYWKQSNESNPNILQQQQHSQMHEEVNGLRVLFLCSPMYLTSVE